MPSVSEINKFRHGGAPTAVDAMRSVPHLIDTCSHDHAHAIRHLHEGRAALESFHGGNAQAIESVAWNCQHSIKHMGSVIEHAEKLGDHIDKHPEMLEKAPAKLMKDFIKLGDKLAKQIRVAEKCLDQAFGLMPNAHANPAIYRQLHSLLKRAHDSMEEANHTIESLAAAVHEHDITQEEYGRLAAHYKMPMGHLPRSTNEWLNETLHLLSPKHS